MSDRLLPTGSSPLEVAAAQACADIEAMPVPLRQLWNAQTCPVALLPYLAWAWSVDRWDSGWSESTKRSVVAASEYVHRHKGTIGSLRRIVEPLGYLIRIIEWWKTGDAPGTFRLDRPLPLRDQAQRSRLRAAQPHRRADVHRRGAGDARHRHRVRQRRGRG